MNRRSFTRRSLLPAREREQELSTLELLLAANRLARRITAATSQRRVVLGGAGAADREQVARRAASVLGRSWLSTSRYIGETEKNLLRRLRNSGSLDAFLFFDEADALFGRRSEVKDSHDRYANPETAYLLQRLESYPGVVILSTDLPGELDRRWLHAAIKIDLNQTSGRP